MMIDIHAHAAGTYGSVDSIKNTAEKYGLEKIVYIECLNLSDRVKEHVYSLNAKRILSI